VFAPLAQGADAAPAILGEDGTVLSHGALRAAVAAARWPVDGKALVWIAARPTPAQITALLAALAAGHAVLPVQAGLPAERRDALAAAYQPELVLDETPPPGYVAAPPPLPGLAAWRRAQRPEGVPHPELALLLATSGSTGSPRHVRLSRAAVAANLAAVAEVLGLGADDRALAHLPFSYSYGLSVILSHLSAGGAVIPTGHGVMEAGLWETARRLQATGFAGVPFHYEVLLRLGLERLKVPGLRHFTQAGGRLDPALVRRFAELCAARDARFFVLYGQTEAGPRMTTAPPATVAAKPAGVGRPLPGGAILIRRDDGAAAGPGEAGEVVYRGPNVMMGYALDRGDLARGDELGGELATGDLGMLDADGDLTLTGRRKLVAKLHGVRIDLEHLEAALAEVAPCLAAERDGRLLLVTANAGAAEALRAAAAARSGVHPSLLWVVTVAELPRLASGKPDRAALEALG
jgi:acyl-coenzyme A synthetase/AMP-(fatty) acid ligase